MKINEEHLVIKKTARYYTNSPSGKITSVNFVIHGYATLGKNFINEFAFLDNDETLIVAPEGLSKFYFRDKIAASWMTKEDRLNEIKDYVNYLDDVYEMVSAQFDKLSVKVNLIGFSQGVHTAARWFVNSGNHFDRLALCSSDFPADTDFSKLRKKLNENAEMFYVHGNHDVIVNVKDSIKMLKENEIDFNEITFNGGHVIDKESIQDLLK